MPPPQLTIKKEINIKSPVRLNMFL